MTAYRAGIGGALTAVVLTVALGGCGGNDGGDSDGGATPPSAGAFELPPEFRDCLVNKGFEIPASGDLHELDPARVQEAIQACGEFLHP